MRFGHFSGNGDGSAQYGLLPTMQMDGEDGWEFDATLMRLNRNIKHSMDMSY